MKGVLTELNICVDVQWVASVGGIERERVKRKPFRIARNGIFSLTFCLGFERFTASTTALGAWIGNFETAAG